MRAPTHAVYAGSFDPITFGHVNVIRMAVRLFDRVTVVGAVNPTKTPMVRQQLQQIRAVIHCRSLFTDEQIERLHGDVTSGLLVDYVRTAQATHLVRGLRGQTDFEAEVVMSRVNNDIRQLKWPTEDPLDTIFVLPPRQLAEVSSSMVRQIVQLKPENWRDIIRQYVPGVACVFIPGYTDRE